MPTFSYKALDTTRTVNSGVLAGRSREEVAQLLTRKGLTPLVVKILPEGTTFQGTVPEVDKITFCRYLSTMLTTGLSLSEGIEVLHQETKHPFMRRILSDMTYSLEQGQQLSSVFERYPSVFEAYFLTLTRAGEVSGKLGEVFKHLEVELRSEYSLKAKVKGALLYPAIVFSAMIGIGILMFFFVLPQIGKVFLSLKLPLPPFTHFLFTTSLVLSKQFIPIMISGVVVLIGIFVALKKREVREVLFRLFRPIPLIRDLIKKVDMARFNRIFSTLIRSAVPITEALEISLDSLTWYEYRNLAKVFPERVRKGETLSEVFKTQKIFPTLVVQMIAAGEKTGTLDATLADLATFYEEEVEEELKDLTQIIEPILMLLVGIGVGAMILSVIAPIYSVIGNFQQAAGGK